MPTDKLLHALVGALIVALLFPVSPLAAALTVSLAAVGKELYDVKYSERHTAEIADAFATLAGGIGAYAALAILLHLKGLL